MGIVKETTKKRPAKPFTGKEGNTFSKDNQPSPEAKKKGWQELRKERLLTQEIIKELIGSDGKPKQSFKDYIRAMLTNAKRGNPKAIETINKCLEDDVLKVDFNITNIPLLNIDPLSIDPANNSTP